MFNELIGEHEGRPLDEASEAAARYLARHDHAMRFARANRALIASRFAGQLGTEARLAMQELFGAKVFLELWVKVKSGWADNEAIVREWGHG